MANKEKKKAPAKRQSSSSSSGGVSLNKIAFYTFVIAAIVLLVQAILTRVLGPSMILSLISAIIQIILYTISGILAFRYVRHKQTVWMVLFILAALVLIVAVVLPIF